MRSEWGLVCEREWVSRLLDALFFVGFGLGATFFGKVSDAQGRKRAHAVSLSLAAAATLLSAAAPGVASYALLRCVSGMGVGGVNIVAYVWACEPIGQVVVIVVVVLVVRADQPVLRPVPQRLRSCGPML